MQPDDTEFPPGKPAVEPEPDVSAEEPFSAIPEAVPQPEPFWGYMDLALVMGLLSASMALILVVVGLIVAFHPGLREDPAPLALPTQFALYAFVYLCFRLVFGLKYHRPVFESLGWRRSRFNLGAAALGGGVLALAVSAIASLLHTPKVASPIDKLVDTPISFALVAVMAVFAAPLFEELFFRGFLQPLLSRTFGVVAGVLVTAVLFGSLHAPEYDWAWQYAAAVAVAGAVFGWVRARTNSIIPCTIMHGCFNAVSVIALAITKYSKYKLDT